MKISRNLLGATAFASTLLLLSGNVTAKELDGKQLHNDNCQRCHDTGVYTRANRRIKSLSSLHTQVQRCATNLSVQWFEDEVSSVTDYLNKTYYKFK